MESWTQLTNKLNFNFVKPQLEEQPIMAKRTMRYFYFGVGVFMVYGLVTINILTWVGNQYKLPPQPGSVQGTIRKSGEIINTTMGSYVLYDTISDYQEEIPSLSEIEEQTRVMFENSMKRKRKILAEINQDYNKSKLKSVDMRNFSFVSIGNISIFSAFYDDRENLDLDSPVIRLIGISPLASTETIVCRYTNHGIDSWILAKKFEMCENHGKLFGGFMFLCKLPKDVDLVPKKIYIKSLNDLEENSQTGNDSSISVDIVAIKRKRVDKMIYQYDRMFDDYDSLGPYIWEERQAENNHVNRKLLNIHDPSLNSSNEQQDNHKTSSPNGNSRPDFLSDENNYIKAAEDISKPPSTSDVAACIPPLYGTIQLSNLIQFLELLKLQKVSQVFVYIMAVSEEVQTVLQFYENQGFLTRIPWPLPQHIQPKIWNNGQIATIQDCLYRTMGNFDYVGFLDIDEAIIPKTAPDWPSMLYRLQKEYQSEDYSEVGGYQFLSAFFDPTLADSDLLQQAKYKLSFLKSIHRTRSYSKARAKLIIQPEYVTEMGIHHVSQPLVTFYNISTKSVPTATGSVHHFRPCSTYADEKLVCESTVMDTSIHKYGDRLSANYHKTVKQLMNIMKMR